MDYYIDSGFEMAAAAGMIGITTAMYLLAFTNCCRTKIEDEADRVIAVVRGEISSLSKVNNENPYDLFTRIYPSLKEMDNERLDEFIELVNKYNTNWIHND